MIREGEQKEEFSETFAVLDKDQDTVISREGHHILNANILRISMMMIIIISMGVAPFTFDPFTYNPFYLQYLLPKIPFTYK